MKTKGLSGNVLKWIAIITMLIDHTAVSIIERASVAREPWFLAQEQSFSMLYLVMRLIGRMAFPLFIFLLVEGYQKTRNVPRYVLRMLIFAIVSEIPYDMATHFYNWSLKYDGTHAYTHWLGLFYDNNVYWTLFAGLLMIWGFDAVSNWLTEKEESGKAGFAWFILHMLLLAAIFLAAMAFVVLVRSDYDVAGILAILVLYVSRNGKPHIGYLLSVLVLIFLAGYLEVAAVAMVPFIMAYNGERGRQNKYFFYAFYPGHLLLVTLVAVLMGMPVFV